MATPQNNPEDFHDATTHRFEPDEKGVCKVCGWWDPNGPNCPGCGKPWQEHTLVIIVAEFGSDFMPGTRFSPN